MRSDSSPIGEAALSDLSMWIEARSAGRVAGRFECDMSLGELQRSLASAINLLKSDEGRWVLSVEFSPPSGYFVQVLVQEDGDMWAECVSDDFLDDSFKMSEAQREALPSLGWMWPGPPSSPNWEVFDPLLSTGSAVAGLFVRTLQKVFHLRDDEVVRVSVYAGYVPTEGLPAR